MSLPICYATDDGECRETRDKRKIARMKKRGYSFVWGCSALEVCVRLNGEHVGTYRSERSYGVPDYLGADRVVP